MDNEKIIQVAETIISDDSLLNYEKLESYLNATTFKFHPSQRTISFPIIERICKRLKKGHTFGPIQISNGIIINGHHRYISLHFLNMNCDHVLGGENINSKYIFKWAEVTLDKEDHDSLQKKRQFEKDYGII